MRPQSNSLACIAFACVVTETPRSERPGFQSLLRVSSESGDLFRKLQSDGLIRRRSTRASRILGNSTRQRQPKTRHGRI